MSTTTTSFLCLWRDAHVRSTLLANLDTESIGALRLTSSECCNLATRPLFVRTHLTFTPSALTRPSRLEALARIGHHVESLTFSMPHTAATFLPPLLNPFNGQEINFLYSPNMTTASVIQRPKYGSPELGDILTQQYPPIFHAATNVPAFINLMKHLPNLRHLTLSCPGQDPSFRYRRDAVDYALISLRIAIEQSPLPHLKKLSLSHIHPSALIYLRCLPGIGSSPAAARKWRQIRKLNIVMDAWDFHGPQPGLDLLKILDDYIRSFSLNLEKVTFRWNGRRGPCPFTLFKDPVFAPSPKAGKLFGEVTSPMSPLPAAPSRPAMTLSKLRYFQVCNAYLAADQAAAFVLEHRHTVKEFDFENVVLSNGGTWEDALAPLRQTDGSEEWQSQQSGSDVDSDARSYQSQSSLGQYEYPDEVIDTLDEDNKRASVHVSKVKRKRVHRRRRRKHRDGKDGKEGKDGKDSKEGKESRERLKISAPIPIPDPVPQILQPSTFDPKITGVQRNIEQEAAHRELAEDPEKRVWALQKAKEAVLRQLSKEFCRPADKQERIRGLLKSSCAASSKARVLLGHESNSALVPLMFSRC